MGKANGLAMMEWLLFWLGISITFEAGRTAIFVTQPCFLRETDLMTVEVVFGAGKILLLDGLIFKDEVAEFARGNHVGRANLA